MTEEKKYPMAFTAPEEDVVPLTLSMVGNLLAASRESPRKRMLQRLHKEDGELVHRMFNAFQPGTYVTPHRHLHPAKTETILAISGALLFVEFDDNGQFLRHTLLQPGTETFGVDVAPHVFHTFVALKPDTLIFEVKTGPYAQESDKNFPDWAPREGTEEADAYLLDLIKLLAERANAEAEALKERRDNEVPTN
ncbi:WbuC family cupin fold metalloprotein [Pseudodesulfovibrio sp.]|uniref:WbuC family cupin fold metalloprotein n=1 Tax=Pseudodesulfovibrio sp. TaxID=2035812 RepID=UPI0026136C4F|nr:WbuC family cupin fold metalloprotein [Pseudodesulfovibrio sp.]MDD3313549.1 WbuC family cupin fold metalloprotein [Pseudodesulfovibrio sp.]